MSNTVPKSVNQLVDMMNDRRFSPHLFGVSMSEESELVNEIFFKIILSYLEIMSRRHELQISAYGNTHIQAQCNKLVGGKGIDLNPFDF